MPLCLVRRGFLAADRSRAPHQRGAIIRCAAGLGWDGVLLAPRAADPLYRRAIKTSMGSVFSMPWARMDDWRDGLATLQRAGFTVAALALRDDAVGNRRVRRPDARPAREAGDPDGY